VNVHWIVPWIVDVFLEGAPDLKSMMTVIIWQYLTKDHITYIYVDHMNHLKRNLVWIFIGWSSTIFFFFFCRQKIKETYLSLTLDSVENKQINVFFSESKPCMTDHWIRGRWYRGIFVIKLIVFTTGQIAQNTLVGQHKTTILYYQRVSGTFNCI